MPKLDMLASENLMDAITVRGIVHETLMTVVKIYMI